MRTVPIYFLPLIIGAAFIVGAIAGGMDGRRLIRKEAIEAGVAEYRFNPKTGETSFHFITREAKP